MKAFFYSLFIIIVLPVALCAQDVIALQKDAEKLEPSSQEEAFKKYQEILRVQPVNLFALCKSSELCSAIGHRQRDKAAKIDYFRAAHRYAEIALRLNPHNSEANFVMAMAMGRMAMVLGGRQKIEAVNDIKKYADLSIRYDPNNYKPYHVLGKWHYEVSNLSGFERSAARIFYGGLPPASMKQAIYCYEKSRSLNPDFTLNYLELARAFHMSGQNDKAREFVNKLIAMPNKTQDDPRIKSEGKKLMAEMR